MVKQGDIIKLNFNPQSGHEQAGYRPAVIVSNNFFNNATKDYPLRVKLDDRTLTTGYILCDHVKSLDINSRGYSFIEKLPEDTLAEVLSIIISEIEY